MAQLSYQRT